MNGFKLRLIPLLVLGLGFLCVQPAFATVTCSVSVSPFSFANVDPQSGQVDVSSNLTYSCSTNRSREGVNLCVSLGNASGSTRIMRDSANNALGFQLYTNSNRTAVWGSQFSGIYQPWEIKFVVHSGSPASATVPVYGRIFAGQSSVIPGSYSRTYLAGVDTRFTIEAALGTTAPSGCGPGNNNLNFGSLVVSANVIKRCTVTASPLSFGVNPGLLSTEMNASTTFGVQCSNTTPYNVGLSAGQHSGNDINARQMALGSNSIGYQLYRDSARNEVWGNTVGTDTVPATGSGMQQNLTVYGSVPPQVTPPAGTYEDTVVVTVTY